MCDRIAILNKGSLVALDSTKISLKEFKQKKLPLKSTKN